MKNKWWPTMWWATSWVNSRHSWKSLSLRRATHPVLTTMNGWKKYTIPSTFPEGEVTKTVRMMITSSVNVCRRWTLQRMVRLSWRTGIVMMLWTTSSVSRILPTQRRWQNSTRRSWEEGVRIRMSMIIWTPLSMQTVRRVLYIQHCWRTHHEEMQILGDKYELQA